MDRTYTRYRGEPFTLKQREFLERVEQSLEAWERLVEAVIATPPADLVCLKPLAADQRHIVAAMRRKFREALVVPTRW
jgi:hypothetical protein